MTLENATVEMLGQARQIKITKEETTIVDGRGKAEEIKNRIGQIKIQIDDTSSDYDREKLQERLAKLSGGVAVLNGRTDSDGDDRVDIDLDGANISPDRVNFAADYETGPFSVRLQTRSYLDRTFQGLPLNTDFDGFTLADAFLRYSAGFGDITLSASNLFDRQYVTYDSQTVQPTSNTRYFAGRGRMITLAFEKSF